MLLDTFSGYVKISCYILNTLADLADKGTERLDRYFKKYNRGLCGH